MSMQLGSTVIRLDFLSFGRALCIQLCRLWISGKCYFTVGVFSEAAALLGKQQVFMLLVAYGRQPCLFQYSRSHKKAVKKNCFVLLLLHLANQNGHARLFCCCWHVKYCVPIVLLYFLPYAVLQKVFCTKICTEVTKPVEIHFKHFNLGLSQINFYHFHCLKKSSQLVIPIKYHHHKLSSCFLC